MHQDLQNLAISSEQEFEEREESEESAHHAKYKNEKDLRLHGRIDQVKLMKLPIGTIIYVKSCMVHRGFSYEVRETYEDTMSYRDSKRIEATQHHMNNLPQIEAPAGTGDHDKVRGMFMARRAVMRLKTQETRQLMYEEGFRNAMASEYESLVQGQKNRDASLVQILEGIPESIAGDLFHVLRTENSRFGRNWAEHRFSAAPAIEAPRHHQMARRQITQRRVDRVPNVHRQTDSQSEDSVATID